MPAAFSQLWQSKMSSKCPREAKLFLFENHCLWRLIAFSMRLTVSLAIKFSQKYVNYWPICCQSCSDTSNHAINPNVYFRHKSQAWFLGCPRAIMVEWEGKTGILMNDSGSKTPSISCPAACSPENSWFSISSWHSISGFCFLSSLLANQPSLI